MFNNSHATSHLRTSITHAHRLANGQLNILLVTVTRVNLTFEFRNWQSFLGGGCFAFYMEIFNNYPTFSLQRFYGPHRKLYGKVFVISEREKFINLNIGNTAAFCNSVV
jgi:hypothetical protein